MRDQKSAILHTKEYSLFSFHKKNRKINYKKVQKLAAAMKENNLLHLFPIVIDKDFTILDGQHRFAAAKEISADLYYVISDEQYSIENVARSNNFQSHWKIEDYVIYYSACDKEEYKKLLHTSIKNAMSPGVVAAVDNGNGSHYAIKTGEFEFTDYELVENILKWAKEFKKKYDFAHWNKRGFLRALKFIIRIKNFNKKILFQQINKNPKLLIKCHEPEEYISLFEEIYNKDNVSGIRFI